MDASLKTCFAPAERATAAELERQIEHFAQDPLAMQIADAVPDLFMILNAQRQLVFANEALSRLTGKALAQLYGQRPGELLGCVHSGESAGGCGTTESCMVCGAVRAILAGLAGTATCEECRITLTSGEALDLRVWATPLAYNGQRLTMFSVQDISHEKRRRTLERVFFHDILNTASLIYGLNELINEMGAEGFASFKDDLLQTVTRLIDEIRGQQLLMAAENGDLRPTTEAIDPRQLLEEIARESAHYSFAAERRMEVKAGETPVTFSSDRTLLRRVIANMVKNALEASKPGDTVTLGYTVSDTHITFAVHNPAFIPRPIQLQIFQRSFSTKGAGRGLGTYSIRLLSEKYLRGQVSFESSETHGTCFRASYPLA